MFIVIRIFQLMLNLHSPLQKEIIYELYIQKPSLYRMVLRYVNKNKADVYGNIKIIPDNPLDNEQELPSVQFKNSSSPVFVTVNGTLVMNPGRWTVRIKVDSNLFLVSFSIYFLLLITYLKNAFAGLLCAIT